MKKNDVAALILIVGFSLGLTYVIAHSILGIAKTQPAKVEKVEKISAEVTKPDPAIFNKDAINPSVSIRIGNSTNQQPFGE